MDKLDRAEVVDGVCYALAYAEADNLVLGDTSVEEEAEEVGKGVFCSGVFIVVGTVLLPLFNACSTGQVESEDGGYGQDALFSVMNFA